MDMERISSGIIGTLAFAFGIHAIVTKQVALGDVEEDEQIWLYGWRAVAIGFLLIAVSAFCFASAFGFIDLDGI